MVRPRVTAIALQRHRSVVSEEIEVDGAAHKSLTRSSSVVEGGGFVLSGLLVAAVRAVASKLRRRASERRANSDRTSIAGVIMNLEYERWRIDKAGQHQPIWMLHTWER